MQGKTYEEVQQLLSGVEGGDKEDLFKLWKKKYDEMNWKRFGPLHARTANVRARCMMLLCS